MSAAFWLALASLLVVPVAADSFDLPHWPPTRIERVRCAPGDAARSRSPR